MDDSTTADWPQQELAAAQDLVHQGSQAMRAGQIEHARGAFDQAEALLDMSADRPDDALQLRAQLYNELGVLHQRRDAIDESRAFHERSLDLCETLLERDVDFRSNAAATYLNLSSVVSATGDLVEAKRLSERAVELITSIRAEGDDSIDSLAIGAYQNMALLYAQSERFEPAEDELHEAVELARNMAQHGDPGGLPQAAQACQRLSVMLFEDGRHADALSWGETAEMLAEDGYEVIGHEVLSIYTVSQINLISYNEQLGRFADAEDALWKGLEVSSQHEDIVERGVAFYENARKQSDKRLQKGNLPRDEVDEGYQELQEMIADDAQ